MLEGRLGEFHLLDILQLLTAAAKTGSLRLDRDGGGARIDLRAGRLLDVIVADRPAGPSAHVAEDANSATAQHGRQVDDLVELLRWREGSFHFEGSADQPPAPETPQSDPLLDDAREGLRQWPHLLARLGGAGGVLGLASPAGSGSVTLTADRWHLVALVDGRRTVDEVSASWGGGRFRALRILVDLLDAGLVAAVPDRVAPGPVALERAGPRGLRTRVRPERLNGTAEDDVDVDVSMIERLIHGVERL